jgi:transcriptional regulator
MYVPRHFSEDHVPTLHGLMAQYGFATLVTTGDGAPFASHLPLLVDREAGEFGTLIGHMARANPQWRGFDGETPALAVFQGPHAYISPSWYESEQAVPTWNYAAVHAYGVPRIVEDHDAALAVLEALVAVHEGSGPAAWRIDSQTADYRDSQIRGIVAFEIPITRLEGKFKLSQNKSEADRLGAARGLRDSGDALAVELARMMEAREDSGKS